MNRKFNSIDMEIIREFEKKIEYMVALAQTHSKIPYRTVVIEEDLVKSLRHSYSYADRNYVNGKMTRKEFRSAIKSLGMVVDQMSWQIEGEWR